MYRFFLLVISLVSLPIQATYSLSDLWHKIDAPDTSLPTLEQLNHVTIAPAKDCKEIISSKEEIIKALAQKKIDQCINIKGKPHRVTSGLTDAIKKYKIINMTVGGCCNGSRTQAHSAHNAYKVGNLSGATVTHDVTTNSPERYDFCQEQDMHGIHTTLKSILAINPDAQIMLHGASKGASCVGLYLSYLTQNEPEFLKHIAGAVMAEPPTSTQSVLKPFLIAHGLARAALPNYHPEKPNLNTVSDFPMEVPVFIARLNHDFISNKKDVVAAVDRLNKEHCANIYLKQYPNDFYTALIHGKIGKHPLYQKDVQAFQTIAPFLRDNPINRC